MKALKILSVMILASTTLTANAMEMTTTEKPLSVSAEIGTFGYGANIGWSVNDSAEVQVGYNGGQVSGTEGDFEIDDVKFAADIDYKAPYVALQLRPFKNWFTVGTGVMYIDDNNISATAEPTAGVDFEYDGQQYTTTSDNAKIMADVGFKNTVAPFATIGVRPNISNNFGLFAEVGAGYTGGLSVDVKAQGDFNVDGQVVSEANRMSTISDLETNAKKEISNEINELDGAEKFFPIFKVGATVRF